MQDWLTWSYWVESPLGAFHFLCAIGALVLGPFIMIRPKGTHLHRWIGRIWAVMMTVIIISALSMYDMTGYPNLFHFFALVSLVTLSRALWAIWSYKRTHNPKRLNAHQHSMVWAYFGLFMAGLWQVVFNLVRSDVLEISIAMLYNGLGSLTAIAAFITFRTLKQIYPHPQKQP
ncbi:DUF2306 domain-containing protein [Fretibacter rubidus]|uniref:DUF2306 domain-containing protein n=1 Tax=Fretibacter rubidus TaxID=570162 RepID=UPI00352B41F3